MSPALRPEAIDSRTVFRAYAWLAIPAGILVFLWPALVSQPDPPRWFAYSRIAAAGITAFGCCAAGFARVDDPLGRRKGLLAFACAHLVFGAMLATQFVAVLSSTPSSAAGWGPLIVGLVLLYLALTGPGVDFSTLPPMRADPGRPGATMFALRNKPSVARLRSEYEQQIRQAARQEERARLARDLHDAVKQQLFVIQTAGATAQARFAADPDGARTAIEQIRAAAREAMSEMEAMLDQLQGAPIENAGLVAFLRKQAEALGFRTGASVDVRIGTLPDETLVDPGARLAIARVAQEVLSNVARHARAKNVTVSLGTADDRLVLTVQDDGLGFSVEGRPHGMGMAGMAARASEVGANLEVASVTGGGTTIRFSVPTVGPSALRPYVQRLAAWAAVLTAVSAVILATGGSAYFWGVALWLIAAIAVARYAVAVYRLFRWQRHR